MEPKINYNFDVKRLKSNISNLRMMSGMTVQDVENRSNLNNRLILTRESIYRWENISDLRCPSVESIISLCNFYNVGIETLLFADIEIPNKEPVDVSSTHHKIGITIMAENNFPKVMIDFYKNLFRATNNEIKEVCGVKIKKVTITETPGYLAFKILKEDNTLNKPLHFLSIFPSEKKQNLRFVFSASKDKIADISNDRAIKLPQMVIDLLSYSPMGAAFTLGYRQRFSELNRNEVVEELFIKEKPEYKANIEDILSIAMKSLWLVTDKKRG